MKNNNSNINNATLGKFGEDYAADQLKKSGYKILNRNYRTKFGEIDIIAQKKNEIIFVEVKTRKADPFVSGVYSVNIKKQRRIIKSAFVYISEYHCDLQPRFDVIEIEVDCKKQKVTSYNHIENAFIQEGEYAAF